MSMRGHPLFPVEEGKDLPTIEWILVQRDSATGPEQCNRRFEPEELPDPETLFDLFGGGSYQLTAYNQGRYAARQRWRFSGPRRPMNGEEEAEDMPPPAAPAAPAQAAGDGGIAQMMLGMFQLLAQQMAAAQQNNTQLVLAVLSGQKDSANQHIQTMQALHNQHAEQMARLMAAMVETKTGGGSSADAIDTLTKGIELGKEIAAQAGSGEEDDTGSDVLEALGSVLSGMAAAQPTPGAPAAGVAAEGAE